MYTNTFWHTLPRPIIGLSPMSGVTDHPFRHIQKKYGNPTILYTEFTSVDGICAGADALLKDFLYDESQRPIIAQVYGNSPRNFYQTAILLCRLGFDGIDINMGCPSKRIAHRGCGAGLIRTPKLAQEIVAATKQGVIDWQNGATERDCPEIPTALGAQIEARHLRLPADYRRPRAVPVSVKTRLGYAEIQTTDWIPRLLETRPAALVLHGRTLAQGYGGKSNWEEIGRAAELAAETETLILGNGDVQSLADAHRRVSTYGLSGALIGRAAYGNPFVFRTENIENTEDTNGTANQAGDPAKEHGPDLSPPFDPERYTILNIAIEHAHLFEQSFSHLERYRFLPMRKHLGWYVRFLPGASHLRRTLTQASSLAEAVGTIEEYLTYRDRWAESARPPQAQAAG